MPPALHIIAACFLWRDYQISPSPSPSPETAKMNPPEHHPHQPDLTSDSPLSLTSPLLSLFSLASRLFNRPQESKETAETAVPSTAVNGSSTLLNKAVMGLVGVAYIDVHPSAVLDFGVEEYDKVVKIVPVGHSCNVRVKGEIQTIGLVPRHYKCLRLPRVAVKDDTVEDLPARTRGRPTSETNDGDKVEARGRRWRMVKDSLRLV
ncbi:hypothetical protein L1987_23828 [Smallanthus sonchifolius]|uniref:Uncharacterized protein n=1 Tax=Smallanthus sonchifolius TaxID=185202 RepID=A0ACB9III9_9ASTR|nr:hypothetical protein L1987_23828 [Smallanthus sonchifolius]